MASVQRNPRDSMKSTWRNDKSQWNLFHWLYEILSLHPTTLNKEIPVHDKSEKIAYLSNFQQQRWVICHAVLPIILHQLYVMYTGHNLSRLAALALYSLSLKLIAIRQLNVMRALGHQYGYLDGDKHVRDQVPDHSVFRVLVSLISTSTLRPMLALVFAYSSAKTPSTINWLFLPLEIGLYGIVLDFWFYWYHRLMHQVEGLWKHHRTHHLTKHPNPLLTLYADTEQEFFDIVGIPVLAYGTLKLLGLPMGFYEWFICNQFVVYTELCGHSGLRMYCTPPSTLYWLLELFNAELVVEDHDLHHRQGWKKSHNYGKQTRLWDRIFGTCADRIESGPENIDYNNRVMLPLLP